MPLPPHAPHDIQLLPTHAITLWSYTSLNDPRLHFGDKYIWMEQDTSKADPLKIGLQVTHDYLWSVGWLAYVNDNTLMIAGKIRYSIFLVPCPKTSSESL